MVPIKICWNDRYWLKHSTFSRLAVNLVEDQSSVGGMEQAALKASCLEDAPNNRWTKPPTLSKAVQLMYFLVMSWLGKNCLTHKIIALNKSIILARLRQRFENRKKYKEKKGGWKNHFFTLHFTVLDVDESGCHMPRTPQSKLHCVHRKLVSQKCSSSYSALCPWTSP